MATQNLISASLTPEQKASILEKLTGLKGELNFLISMVTGERNEYIKVGNVMLPFMDIAHSVSIAHPEILSAVFDKLEYDNDYKLTKDLVEIGSVISELNSSVQATLFAANSDTMVESLDVYAAAQANQKKVPGLEVDVAEMRTFFKKGPRPPKQPPTP